ncbi:uncharacterized protein METZ01_LOCUS460160, partial [marine metagenome]
KICFSKESINSNSLGGNCAETFI